MPEADVTIGGLGFRMVPSNEFPYTRSTGEYRKQQFDSSKEPGEQSLSQWWVRTQDSWHRGAGIVFYDPGSDGTTQYRFRECVGLDPWTPGQLTIQPAVEGLTFDVMDPSATYATSDVSAYNGRFYVRVDDSFAVYHPSSGGGSVASGTATDLRGPIRSTGTKHLVGASGKIVQIDFGTSATTTFWTAPASDDTLPYWVKNRVIASCQNKLWELTIAGVAGGSPIFEHPDTNFRWVGVAEAPGAIIAAGNEAGRGLVYRFVLQDSGTAGSLPVLGTGIQCAELPAGEEITSLLVHLGTYVGLGTTKGLRIGTVDDEGKIQYGPLTVDTKNPVRGLSAYDGYMYGGVQAEIEGQSGVVRVDLTEQTGDLRFAWAWDMTSLDPNAGPVTSTAVLRNTDAGVDRTAWAVSGWKAEVSAVYNTRDSGYLLTGRMRFATTEPKTFVAARLLETWGFNISNGLPLDGSVTIEAQVNGDGNWHMIATVDQDTDLSEDISLQVPGITGRWQDIEFKLTLAITNVSQFGHLDMFSVKALPMPQLPRVIKYPLAAFDNEVTTTGLRTGTHGSAWQKIASLEAMQEEQALVTVLDNTNGESYQGHITDVQFIRDSPPTSRDGEFGGRVYVTLTKLG